MRSVFFFLAVALGIGFLFTIGRFLFAIWFAGVVLALTLFAIRGIRHFVRQGRAGYLAGDFRDLPRALPFPEEQHREYEPLVPAWRKSPEELTGVRIIRVE